MSLNSQVQAPYHGDFTLESLGLSGQPENIDHLNDENVLGYQTPNSLDATITTDTTNGEQTTTSMADSETAQLPDWNTKINLITENANKIVDMKAVQKDIEDGGSMSQDKAQEIQATFEGFFDNSNKLHHFTTFESKTGYNKAIAFMSSKIQATSEALITEFREAQAGSIGELARAIDKVREFCSEDLRDMVNKAINEISAVHELVKAGPIVLPFEGDIFIDMTAVNLLEVDVDKIKYGVPVSEEFKLAYSKMKELWGGNEQVRLAICNMAGINSHSEMGDYPCDLKNLYLKTICHAFREESGSVVMNTALDYFDSIEGNIQKRWEETQQPLQLTVESLDVISSQAKDLLNESNQTTILEKDMIEVSEFAKACSIVVLGLVSLK